jgi:PRC-barrel domain protein
MQAMSEDRGVPVSYLTLEPGTPVFASDGTEVGRVEHVLADADADIFDGLVIDTRVGPGGHRFVDAPLVAEIAERGVTLTVDAAGVERLPAPSENPAEMSADPDEGAESNLSRKLRRAWDLISGRY